MPLEPNNKITLAHYVTKMQENLKLIELFVHFKFSSLSDVIFKVVY
jgi:hypothetical protein